MCRKLSALLALIMALMVLVGSCAGAEPVAKIGGNLFNGSEFIGELPDGRMIFFGTTGENRICRLLCLEPEGTVSWELKYFTHDMYAPVITEDGTIAIPGKDKIVFLSPEGKETGKEIPLATDEGIWYELTSRGMMKYCRAEDAVKSAEFIDWEGQTLFSLDPGRVVRGEGMIADQDGLLMMGHAQGADWDEAIKVVRVDWQGKILWERPLPRWKNYDWNYLRRSKVTSDGGILVLYTQEDFKAGVRKGYTALIKIGADTEILWTKEAVLDGEKGREFTDVAEYGGKYVITCRMEKQELHSATQNYLWLDADGNELGTVRQSIRQVDFPDLEDQRDVDYLGEELFSAGGNLWQVFTAYDVYPDNIREGRSSERRMLFRIPTL